MSITIFRTRSLRLGASAAVAALLAVALFAVASADNGLVTCPGPAYDTDCTKPNGQPVTQADINSGQWYRFNYAGEVYFGQPGLWADKVTDRNSNPVLSDAPAPAVLPVLQSNGQLNNHGVYQGDTRFGQLNNAPEGPLVYRARGDYVEGGVRTYTYGDNHRVVRANDGTYYREELVRGQWVRSSSYDGPYAEARASWNAALRCQGESLRWTDPRNWVSVPTPYEWDSETRSNVHPCRRTGG